jgi:hypothetical protein
MHSAPFVYCWRASNGIWPKNTLWKENKYFGHLLYREAAFFIIFNGERRTLKTWRQKRNRPFNFQWSSGIVSLAGDAAGKMQGSFSLYGGESWMTDIFT